MSRRTVQVQQASIENPSFRFAKAKANTILRVGIHSLGTSSAGAQSAQSTSVPAKAPRHELDSSPSMDLAPLGHCPQGKELWTAQERRDGGHARIKRCGHSAKASN